MLLPGFVDDHRMADHQVAEQRHGHRRRAFEGKGEHIGRTVAIAIVAVQGPTLLGIDEADRQLLACLVGVARQHAGHPGLEIRLLRQVLGFKGDLAIDIR